MKHKLLIILTAVVSLLLSSCGKIHEIGVTSYDITSVTPSGLRSVDGVITVGIHNPTFAFTISDIHGTIYHKGNSLADFSADPVEVKKKCDEVYDIHGHASLSKGTSVLSLLSLIRDINPEDYSMDIHAKVKAKGFTKSISKTGILVSQLVGSK